MLPSRVPFALGGAPDDAQVGRVGAAQEGGIRRLGAAGAGQHAQGQATDQPDEEHEREVAGPAAGKRRAKAKPRDS